MSPVRIRAVLHKKDFFPQPEKIILIKEQIAYELLHSSSLREALEVLLRGIGLLSSSRHKKLNKVRTKYLLGTLKGPYFSVGTSIKTPMIPWWTLECPTLLPEQHTQKDRKPVKPKRPRRKIGMMGFSPEPGKLAGAYVRVSTEDQAKGGVSLEAQEHRLRRYAEMANWQLYKVYVDAGLSAGSTDRPAFQEMLRDARSGRINVVLVYKLDRFSRSLKDIILTIDELKQLNVDFVSITESIDTSTPIGKVMFHIIGAFAEFERDVIAQRTSLGMNQKTRKGHVQFRAPFGYVFVEGVLRVQETDAEVVRAMFRDRASGMSVHRISDKYGMPYPSVRWILHSPFYVGLLRWKGELVPGKHQPIIDKKTWEVVQKSWKHPYKDLQKEFRDLDVREKTAN